MKEAHAPAPAETSRPAVTFRRQLEQRELEYTRSKNIRSMVKRHSTVFNRLISSVSEEKERITLRSAVLTEEEITQIHDSCQTAYEHPDWLAPDDPFRASVESKQHAYRDRFQGFRYLLAEKVIARYSEKLGDKWIEIVKINGTTSIHYEFFKAFSSVKYLGD